MTSSARSPKRPPVETEAALPKPPVEKPVEKKPDPPKPVAESKPKDEPKPIEKKPDPPKVDPIAEALKHDDAKKPVPKAEAKAAPPQPPQKPKERVFDPTKMAALLDKRDPTRQAATGAQLNSHASLGTSRGTAATLSQSELDALRARLASLWNVQPGTERPEELFVAIRIRLTPDRRLAGAAGDRLERNLAALSGGGGCRGARGAAGPALRHAAGRHLRAVEST